MKYTTHIYTISANAFADLTYGKLMSPCVLHRVPQAADVQV